MGMIVQIMGAYLATVTSGIILEIPRNLRFKTGFIGASGYFVYLWVLTYADMAIATLMGGIVIAFLSQIAARVLKSPVTVFYIPSFFPLVPGAGVYKIAYYYIQGNMTLASNNFTQSMMVSGAIALSVFLVDSGIEVYSTLKNSKKKQKF